MRLIKADFNRRLEIPGVPDPVQRPVDIDKSQTGFVGLRSLRIYRFDVGSVIDGHAEEDEVLIVVLSGNIELTMSEEDSLDKSVPFTMSAADEGHNHPCVAYLPPHGSYRLAARSNAEVAYARATPAGGRAPRVFRSHARSSTDGLELLFEEANYAERLRLRLISIHANERQIDFAPVEVSENNFEALVHVRAMRPEMNTAIARTNAESIPLGSWDTLAISPGEHPTLAVTLGVSVFVLVVLAI